MGYHVGLSKPGNRAATPETPACAEEYGKRQTRAGLQKHVCKQRCLYPASSARHSSWDKQDVREDYVSFLPFISFPGLQPNSSVLFRTFQKALHKVKTSGLHLNSKIKLLFVSPGHLQRQRKNECRHWPIHFLGSSGPDCVTDHALGP